MTYFSNMNSISNTDDIFRNGSKITNINVLFSVILVILSILVSYFRNISYTDVFFSNFSSIDVFFVSNISNISNLFFSKINSTGILFLVTLVILMTCLQLMSYTG